MPRRTVPVLLLFLALAVAACGGATDDTRPPGVRTGSVPTGADEVVFRVDTRGGYTTVETQLAIVPQVSVYGDGRVVVDGPVTEQYPPHALPNLLTGTLDGTEINRLARRAVELGLLERHDYGTPGIADAPTTNVTIAVDGRYEQTAYALDFDGGVGSEPPGASSGSGGVDGDAPVSSGAEAAGVSGVTPTQAAAREALRTWVRELGDAAHRVAAEPYAAQEVAVFARSADGTQDDFGVPPGSADWPLGDLATLGTPHPDAGPGADPVFRCAVLTGDDARVALAAAGDATAITRWNSAGADYVLIWRPLLPDEQRCPDPWES